MVVVTAPRPVVPPSVLKTFAFAIVADAPTAVNAAEDMIKAKLIHSHFFVSFLKNFPAIEHSVLTSAIAAWAHSGVAVVQLLTIWFQATMLFLLKSAFVLSPLVRAVTVNAVCCAGAAAGLVCAIEFVAKPNNDPTVRSVTSVLQATAAVPRRSTRTVGSSEDLDWAVK